MGYRTLQQNYARLAYLGLPIDDMRTMRDLENAKSHLGGAMMDLGYDFLYERSHGTYSMALSMYYRHESGDMMADPDYQLLVSPRLKTVEVLAWQMDGIAHGYKEVYDENSQPNLRLYKSLNLAFGDWLNQLHLNGYSFAKDLQKSSQEGCIPDPENEDEDENEESSKEESTTTKDNEELTLTDQEIDRVRRGFEEINTFVDQNKREPSRTDWIAIIELQLGARLNSLRERKEFHKYLKDHDRHGLLAS